MFRLLSRESNIFSIPVYIVSLLVIILVFNIPNWHTVSPTASALTLAAAALGLFTFGRIGLHVQNHLTMLLYTLLFFAFYEGSTSIALATTLLTNTFLLLILTSTDKDLVNRSIVLIGAISALNFLIFPASWPTLFFLLLHLLATTPHIAVQYFRFFFGSALVYFAYFILMYAAGYRAFDDQYLVLPGKKFITDYDHFYYLIPLALAAVYGLADHFVHYNEKSPASRFKFTFVLIFGLAQLVTVILYMNLRTEYLLLLAIPGSILISRMIRFIPKPWIREVVLFLLLVSLIVFRISGF